MLIKYGYGTGGHRVTPGLQGSRAHQCASAAPLCFAHKQAVAVLRRPKATDDPRLLEPDRSHTLGELQRALSSDEQKEKEREKEGGKKNEKEKRKRKRKKKEAQTWQ